MSHEQRFERWIGLARRDEPETVDVTYAVMARIARTGRTPSEPVDRTLLAFALGALAAAGIVTAIVIALDPSLGDPLADLLQSVSVVMR